MKKQTIYLLDTDEVRRDYEVGVYNDGVGPEGPDVRDSFDRWLAGIKAVVWDEGYKAGASWNDGLGEYVDSEANPYGPTSIQ